MISQASLSKMLCCLLIMSGLIKGTSLVKIKISDENPVQIGSAQAHDFLTNSRPKRNVDPKWYRGDPDFQSYYRFYNSIGHIEGLYEIDRIRMLYQQMRHLELTYGPDASTYQNTMGVLTSTAAPSTTTQPPPPPTTPAPAPDPLENAQKVYLCNPKDPLCKPQIVYLPAGAVPILCDPRFNPECRHKTEEEIRAAAPPQLLPDTPAPPVVTHKDMEYDCDPYWDPDCLIDNPPHPALETATPAESVKEKMVTEEDVKSEETVPEAPASDTQKTHFDPYDFKRDLYDPFRYAQPAPDPQ